MPRLVGFNRKVGNTFLCGLDYDDIKPKVKCGTFRGGHYYPDRSDIDGSLGEDFQSQPERWRSDTYESFVETILFREKGSLTEFPLARPLNVSSWDL